jgi:hypothetical protein
MMGWREKLAQHQDPADVARVLSEAQAFTRINGHHQYDLLVGSEWERVPNVTSIGGVLDKPSLVGWAANEQLSSDIATAWEMRDGPEITDPIEFENEFRTRAGQVKAYRRKNAKAQDIGHQVHALIERYFKAQLGLDPGAVPAISDEALWVYGGFEREAKDRQLRALCVEQRVFSARHQFAGTLDWFGECEGQVVILDWKSSSGGRVYPQMAIQSVAYRKCVEEMTGLMPGGTVVLLPKGNVVALIEFKPVVVDPEETWEMFLGLRRAHDWLKEFESQQA